MNNFLGPLRLDYVDGKTWYVVEGFTYRIGSDLGHEYVHIPEGFVTDFASIPRLLKVQWPSPGGLWDKPAVVHDFLYRFAYVTSDDATIREVNRQEADAIFLEGMRVTQTRESAARCLYAGVRIGGWRAWRKHRRAES